MYLLSECQAAFTTANGNTRMFRDDAELERMFYIRARWSTDDKSGLPLFSNDCSKCYYASGTVAYLMLQLAVYMGFREIYLLGIDMSYSYKFYRTEQLMLLTAMRKGSNKNRSLEIMKREKYS